MGYAYRLSDEEIEESLPQKKKRIKTKFLWLPKTIKGQTKWFQLATFMIIKVENTYYHPISKSTSYKTTWESFKWL